MDDPQPTVALLTTTIATYERTISALIAHPCNLNDRLIGRC